MPKRASRPALDALFGPQSVALIGATEAHGSVGRAVMENLRAFAGPVYPVNPHRESVLGVKAFPSIAALPEYVDLAVIATPAPTVPEIVGECALAGVPVVVILSAGFKECDPEMACALAHKPRMNVGKAIGDETPARDAGAARRGGGDNFIGIAGSR